MLPSRPFAKWEHLKAVFSQQTSIWSERSGENEHFITVPKKAENELLTWKLLWTWQQCKYSPFPGTHLSGNVATEADCQKPKMGILIAKDCQRWVLFEWRLCLINYSAFGDMYLTGRCGFFHFIIISQKSPSNHIFMTCSFLKTIQYLHSWTWTGIFKLSKYWKEASRDDS